MFENWDKNWDNNPVVVFLKEQWGKLKILVTPFIDSCFGNRGESRNIDKKGDRSEVEPDAEVKNLSSSSDGANQSPQKKESPAPLTQISETAPEQLLASPTSPARPLAQEQPPASPVRPPASTERPLAQTSEPAPEQPPASPVRPLAQEKPKASPMRSTHQNILSEQILNSEENLIKLSGNSMFSPDGVIAVPLLSNLKKIELQIIGYRKTLHDHLANESGDDFLGNLKKLIVVLFGDDFLNSAIQLEDLKFNGIFFHKEGGSGNKEIWMKEGCENEIKDLFKAFKDDTLTDKKIKKSVEDLKKFSDESKANKLPDNVDSLSPIANVGSIFFSYLPTKINEAIRIKRITSLQSGSQGR